VPEGHRERKADEAARQALHEWQGRHDAYISLIEAARTFEGGVAEGILLAPGETVFLQVSGCALIEERRGGGTFVGHSQGVSIPVVRIGGRQIRYRVGASKGHYVQAEPTPTPIDTGTVTVTSSRVVFQGMTQTRECPFAKLIGYHHDAAAGVTTFSESNRKTPVTVCYGPGVAETFEFRLDLALARFRGTVDDLVAGLEADLSAIDAARPALPGAGDGVPEGSPDRGAIATGSAVGPGWYRDPWGSAPLRWWDGRTWSWQTAAPGAPPPG
jgi:hypothetical protein